MPNDLVERNALTQGMIEILEAAVKAKLASEGFTQIRDMRSHQGCYEAKGFDSVGKRFEIEVNAYTGAIINKE